MSVANTGLNRRVASGDGFGRFSRSVSCVGTSLGPRFDIGGETCGRSAEAEAVDVGDTEAVGETSANSVTLSGRPSNNAVTPIPIRRANPTAAYAGRGNPPNSAAKKPGTAERSMTAAPRAAVINLAICTFSTRAGERASTVPNALRSAGSDQTNSLLTR